jgi:hypothetical protein
MNQRREPRFRADQQVRITVYGTPDLHLNATVRNVSGRGMGIEVEGPLAAGSALKIEMDDAILLGEVIYVRDEGKHFYLGVELEQTLVGLADLARAVRPFWADAPDSRAQEAHPVEEARREHEQ